MAPLKYQKPSPFVQMSPGVSRIRSDNGCLRAEPQCEENPSFSAIKSPKRKRSPAVIHDRKKRRVFISMQTHLAPPLCFNTTCCSKRLPVIWELTIKNDGLFNNHPLLCYTDTSPLRAFSRPKWPLTSHPSTLNPACAVQEPQTLVAS